MTEDRDALDAGADRSDADTPPRVPVSDEADAWRARPPLADAGTETQDDGPPVEHDERWVRDEYVARKRGLGALAGQYADERASARERRREDTVRETSRQAGLDEATSSLLARSRLSSSEAKQIAGLLRNAPADQAQTLLKQIEEARR